MPISSPFCLPACQAAAPDLTREHPASSCDGVFKARAEASAYNSYLLCDCSIALAMSLQERGGGAMSLLRPSIRAFQRPTLQA